MKDTQEKTHPKFKKIEILKKNKMSAYEQSLKTSKVFNDPIIKNLFKSQELRALELNLDHKFYADLIPKSCCKTNPLCYIELAVIKLLCSTQQRKQKINNYLERFYSSPDNELIKMELPKVDIDYASLKRELSSSNILKSREKDYTKAIKYINKNWENLYRKTPKKTESSLIPLPKAFIVPGGRFREIYYWDTYFTSLGLNRSKLSNISEDMAENFLHLVNEYGFIPNGNRTYYLSRSQPPVFALMVEEIRANKNNKWLEKYYNAVAKEYKFWMRPDERYIEEIGLNRYYDSKDTARLEAFGDDNKNLTIVPSKFYQNERAICESGLDFSKKYSDGPLNVISIELNSLLYKYETLLSEWAIELGKKEEATHWSNKAEVRKQNMFKYLYDKKDGIFKDYSLKKQKHTNTDNLMMMFPLWVNLLSKDNKQEMAIAKQVRDYVITHFEKEHGLVLTKDDVKLDNDALIVKEENEYQWDSPNGWAPLQYIATKGLENYGFEKDATRLMKKWVDLNTDIFKKEGKFFEKYNVVSKNENARTCYPEQDGFGWTNGIYLEFIHTLKDKKKLY